MNKLGIYMEHRGRDRHGQDVWRGQVENGRDENGRRKRLSVTIHGARKEAEAKWAQLLLDSGGGTPVPASGMLARDFFVRWLEHAKVNVAAQTYRRQEQIVNGELIPAFGSTKLVDISALQIELFLARSLGRRCKNRPRDLSPRTVRHFYQVLRRALGQAVRWQLIPRNPCDLVDPPRVQAVEMQALDEDGLIGLLGAVRGTRLYVPTLLASVTGLRRGELLALRWSDVDLETGECRVVRALQEVPGEVSFKAPKTNKGRRVVLLPRLALMALKAHRAIQNEGKLLLGPGYQDQDLILARADGTPWPPSQFSSEFARLVKKKGIQITFHGLRHSHASQLLKAGVPVKVVSERLGHSTTSVTMDIYAHTLPNMQAEAVAKIDAALGKAIGE